MNISLVGNCQAKALVWYLSQLNEQFDVKYISIEMFRETFGRLQNFEGKPTPSITNTQEAVERLQNSNFIIYQNILESTSKDFNFKKIREYSSVAKLISFSSMIYDPNDPNEFYQKGMADRDKQFNVDITANQIIEKHGNKVKVLKDTAKPNHPCSFYFLELVREICIKAKWEYYTNEQYNFYLKERYPFC